MCDYQCTSVSFNKLSNRIKSNRFIFPESEYWRPSYAYSAITLNWNSQDGVIVSRWPLVWFLCDFAECTHLLTEYYCVWAWIWQRLTACLFVSSSEPLTKLCLYVYETRTTRGSAGADKPAGRDVRCIFSPYSDFVTSFAASTTVRGSASDVTSPTAVARFNFLVSPSIFRQNRIQTVFN